MRTINEHLGDLELAERCADHLERHTEAIVCALTEHESHEAATAELESSIDALRNLHRELAYLRKGNVETISVFLPINLPLYSLILFGAVPSLMAGRVDVRLPAATPDWVQAVATAAKLHDFFPRLHLHTTTRRQFIERYASVAEAVIFTGRHESAEQVRKQCPRSLFIFQGSGVNPIVVGPRAVLTSDVIERLLTVRVFNGGQDCAAPDAFLVHADRADAFITALVDRLRTVRCGSYRDPAVRVGTILNPQPLGDVAAWLHGYVDDTVVGGRVDLDAAYVEPTVVVRPLREHGGLMEFFAPIFYVLVYDSDDELAEFFADPSYTENAMYVSLFGQDVVPGLFETSTVLFNRTVLDVEQGNAAFGGNGTKANYVAYGRDVVVGPVLISEVLASAPCPERRSVSSPDWIDRAMPRDPAPLTRLHKAYVAT